MRDQAAELTTDLIAKVRDIDADTATKLEELKAKLDDLSDTLEEYKLEISSRRVRRQADSCSSLAQQLDKLATLRTETEELIALADTILELTILPDDVRTLIETFKDYHENHLEEINDEEAAKKTEYGASCESTTEDGETLPGSTGGNFEYIVLRQVQHFCNPSKTHNLNPNKFYKLYLATQVIYIYSIYIYIQSVHCSNHSLLLASAISVIHCSVCRLIIISSISCSILHLTWRPSIPNPIHPIPGFGNTLYTKIYVLFCNYGTKQHFSPKSQYFW